MEFSHFFIIGRIRTRLKKEYGIVPPFFQSRLNKVPDQLRVTAMSVDDDNFIETISSDLVTGRFQQIPYNAFGQRKAAVLMSCFVDLSVKIIRENNRVFFFRCPGGPFTNLDQVRSDRNKWAVLF